jgi:hypothetical protein
MRNNWQDLLSRVIMACFLKSGFYVPKLNESMLVLGTSRYCKAKSITNSVLSFDFMGKFNAPCSLKSSRDVSIHVCKSVSLFFYILLSSYVYLFFPYINSMFLF